MRRRWVVVVIGAVIIAIAGWKLGSESMTSGAVRRESADFGVMLLNVEAAKPFAIASIATPGAVPVLQSRSCTCLGVDFDEGTVSAGGSLTGSVRLKPTREGAVTGRAVMRVGIETVELSLRGFVIAPVRCDVAAVVLRPELDASSNVGVFNLVAFSSTSPEDARSPVTLSTGEVKGALGDVVPGGSPVVRPHRGGSMWLIPMKVRARQITRDAEVALAVEHRLTGPSEIRVPLTLAPAVGVQPAVYSGAISAGGSAVLLVPLSVGDVELVSSDSGSRLITSTHAAGGTDRRIKWVHELDQDSLFAAVTAVSAVGTRKVTTLPIRRGAAVVGRRLQ